MICRAAALALYALFCCGAAAWAAPVSLPWIGQKTETECGRAVLAALGAARGGDPEAAYRRLPAPPDAARGYSVADMQRFAKRVGVRLTLKAPEGLVIAGECSRRPAVRAHYRMLARLVSSGRPVVVPVSTGFGAGHYLILVGAQGSRFTVHDPAAPGLRDMDEDTLISRMCNFGYVALIANN